MAKILGQMAFMLSFYWLGMAFAVSASADNALALEGNVDPAIHCSAAIEVMGRSAPQWAQQPDIAAAKRHWDDRIGQLKAKTGQAAETDFNREVSLLIDAFSEQPSEFARAATKCANISSTDDAVSG